MSIRKGEALVLLKDVESKNLLKELIHQLNRDLNLTGINDRLSPDSNPLDTVLRLHRIILNLIQNDFNTYLNLLYRIDIPEQQVRSIEDPDPLVISEKVTEMILKRVWQKVWFRSKNL